MSYRVHIKIADRDWILEKCASEIVKRASNVSYSQTVDPQADIQYYVNYSARSGRVSPIEIAFFTHSEKVESARARYFAAAREVDAAVCMSRRYADELKDAGVDDVSTIAPGVDLTEFQPRVRVGVVGRTYHTGRKGEALVASVMDVDGIEWKFTGHGWPGEAEHIPVGKMADFYNSVDYVLVPSYFEGGPMSVLEALACGRQVIASDVGWVNEFPHIPFENGNAQSLRSVLTSIVEERKKLVATVRSHSWDNWADQHIILFDKLAKENGIGRGKPQPKVQSRVKAVLVTHHAEGTLLGGPTVRIPRTASALATHGVDAILQTASGEDYRDRTVAHVFNIWPPRSALAALRGFRRAGKSTVFSPIFLNLSNTRRFSKDVPEIFGSSASEGEIARSLDGLAESIRRESRLPTAEPFAGYHSKVRAAVAAADATIVLSEYERESLAEIGADVSHSAIVRNPVDSPRFASADPNLFSQTYGVKNYVLCVGRIEARKNQLLVAHATRLLGIQAVFIGHEASAGYAKLVRRFAGPDALFVPRLDYESELLPSAYAGAAAFCLPSWAEGAPLAAMEAAATGAPLVLSDRSGEREYFGNFAEYVNPADLRALKQAILTAVEIGNDEARRAALKEHMAKNFSWDRYAADTAKVYRSVKQPTVAPRAALDARILFDLTTTYHFNGTPTGIARLERDVFDALIAVAPERIQPVVWNSRSGRYLAVPKVAPPRTGALEGLASLEVSGDAHVLTAKDAPTGSYMLMVGGGWIRNARLGGELAQLRTRLGIPIVVLVHDLIQSKFKSLYPPGAGEEFHKNASLIAETADAFLAYSEATRSDLQKLLLETGNAHKSILRFRMGSTLHQAASLSRVMDAPSAKTAFLAGKRYALFVSSIDPRKNHVLLINVWRRLIEQRGSSAPHLVLVGRPFWRGEEILDVIRRDPQLSRYIHILSDLEDDDLDWCYRHATFTLFPSIYEGWGLPIAESLSYGKLCIVADASSTREVAPELTDLIDPYDFKGWLNRIALYFDNPAALAAKEEAIREKHIPYLWSQAAQEIVEKVEAAALPMPNYPPIEPFTRLETTSTSDELNKAVLADGWDSSTPTGCELGAREGVIRFRYLGPAKSVWVRVHCAPSDARRRLRIAAGNVEQQVELEARSLNFDLELVQAPDAAQGISLAIRRMEETRFILTHLSFADTAADLDLFGPAVVSPAPTKKTKRSSTKPSKPRAKSWLPRPRQRLSNRTFLYRALKKTGLESPALGLYSILYERITRSKKA